MSEETVSEGISRLCDTEAGRIIGEFMPDFTVTVIQRTLRPMEMTEKVVHVGQCGQSDLKAIAKQIGIVRGVPVGDAEVVCFESSNTPVEGGLTYYLLKVSAGAWKPVLSNKDKLRIGRHIGVPTKLFFGNPLVDGETA